MTNITPPNADDMQLEPGAASSPRKIGTSKTGKSLMLLGLIVLAGLVWFILKDYLDLQYLSGKETELREFQSEHPLLVYGVAFALYVVVTGLSLPGAAPLSLLYAWYFGLLPAVILISFASTAGATVAFLLSRYLFREAVLSRFGDRLTSIEGQLQRDGAFYLLGLRLVPLIPFFVINLVMGLTAMRTKTFWWVSQLGMLPGTIVYAYAGSRVPGLGQLAEHGASAVFTPGQIAQLTIAFALLGLFPLIARKILGHYAVGNP